ncbi:hypothetical protein PF001_g26855 [Phytophthora fragariae]|nr:hypothetical protein PF001_g26855 [Phytophthora fragariae]
MGQTMVIPGIGGPGLPTDMTSTTGVQGDTNEVRHDMEHAALFTNPQGVYNAVTGTWDPPPGHQWNGKYWYEPKKTERKWAAAASPASGRTVTKKTARSKPKRETVESSSDESDAKPKKKKLKAAVKQAAGDKRRVEEQAPEEKRLGKESWPNSGVCFQCGQPGHWSTQCPNEPKCFACNQPGHFARACTDTDAKARNNVYMQQRGRKTSRGRDNGGMASRTRRKSPAGGVDDEGRRRNDATGGDVGSGRSAGRRSRPGNCPAGERKRWW